MLQTLDLVRGIKMTMVTLAPQTAGSSRKVSGGTWRWWGWCVNGWGPLPVTELMAVCWHLAAALASLSLWSHSASPRRERGRQRWEEGDGVGVEREVSHCGDSSITLVPFPSTGKGISEECRRERLLLLSSYRLNKRTNATQTWSLFLYDTSNR